MISPLLSQICCFSLILWFCIDRIKFLWDSYSWGKYVTLGLSVGIGELLAFGFNLDFIYTMELFSEVTIIGKIFTGIILSAGASPIAELVASLKAKGKSIDNIEI